MSRTMTVLFLLAGIALLAVGGDVLVRGAVGAARALGVSPLLVGLTVVGFGTSMPELVTSLIAAFAGSPGLAVGNVLGSNIGNILLILGVSALVAPILVERAAFRRDGTALALATLAGTAAVLSGRIGALAGAGLLVLLAGYLVVAYRSERAPAEAEMREHVGEDVASSGRAVAGSLALALVGIAATVGGARLLVDASVAVARSVGLSEAAIGLSVVAIGTSLPELVACVAAARRGHSDVALGNVVGSNLFNLLGVLGATAAIHPLVVPSDIRPVDLVALAGATGLLLVFLRTGWRLSRREGGVFLLLYAGYMAVTLVG